MAHSMKGGYKRGVGRTTSGGGSQADGSNMNTGYRKGSGKQMFDAHGSSTVKRTGKSKGPMHPK